MSMLRQSLLATALVLSLVACTAAAEPFDEQISDDVTISDVAVTALDGAAKGKRSYELSYTLINNTGKRMWVIVTQQGALGLLPDAQDPQTLVLMDDFPPAEEDNTSTQPPYFDIELVKPDETISRRFAVGITTENPLLDLSHVRVCVAFIRESTRFSDNSPTVDNEPERHETISQSRAHSLREVACSPAIPMPAVLSN